MKKLLELSNMVRAALSEGKKLSCAELEDLNFVFDMMVRGWSINESSLLPPSPETKTGV